MKPTIININNFDQSVDLKEFELTCKSCGSQNTEIKAEASVDFYQSPTLTLNFQCKDCVKEQIVEYNQNN